MYRRKHLIIGSGTAALSALEEIRRSASEDEVKLVTMEECPPYSPASLPYLLSGRITENEIWKGDESYFKDLRSTLATGKEVTRIVPEKRRVIYRDGTSEHYDTLLIASGSEPIMPAIRGMDTVGARTFRVLADCRFLLRDLQHKKDLAILGAGIVGMKLALALTEKHYRINIIDKEENILPLYFNEEAADYIRNIFIEHNVHLFTGHAITYVARKNGKITIAFSNGGSIHADILINTTGVRSRVSFVEGTGIQTRNGILVDRTMNTGVEHVYAAGDVVEAHDFFTGQLKVSAIMPSAVRQGRVAGANMVGGNLEYEGGIAATALSFFGNRAFSMGLPAPVNSEAQVWKEKDDQKRSFKKLIFSGERLVGGMFVNEQVDPGIIFHLIKNRVNMTPYKEALFERTKPLSNPWLNSLKFSRANSQP